MLDRFFKFPRTPHLWWPLPGPPKDDRVLDPAKVEDFLAGDVVVEEKVDGANLGLSVDDHGDVRAQNRGSWIERGANPQFQPVWGWISQRKHELVQELATDHIAFGEWCFAVHTVRYERLPDWFLGFDVYDIDSNRFWCAERRDRLFSLARVCPVPRLFRGRATLADLQSMLISEGSRLGNGPVEGLYIRRDGAAWLEARAKLVRPEFLEEMGTHWSNRAIERNKLSAIQTPQS